MQIPRRIEVGEGSTLVVAWTDGREDRLEAETLRIACPCAACGGDAVASGASIVGVRLVREYALGITFGPDGHSTGIFSFDLLRRLGDEAAA